MNVLSGLRGQIGVLKSTVPWPCGWRGGCRAWRAQNRIGLPLES